MFVYLPIVFFTATLMYIATVAIIIDVSTLGTLEVEWGVSPCRSRPPFWCLILWWNRCGDLGKRAPGDFTFGCPICKWAERQCGSTPGSQAGWHALLLLLWLLLLLLLHYHKGCGSPRPLSGVYIEHWCKDNAVFCSCFFWIKKKYLHWTVFRLGVLLDASTDLDFVRNG